MKRLLSIFLILSILSISAAAADNDFTGIRCDSEIAPALIGRHMENAPVKDIEKKYQKLNLHDMGADEISDQWSLIAWEICDRFVMLLQNGDRVMDAIPLPAIAESEIPMLMTCRAGNKDLQNVLPVIRKNKIIKAWQADLHAKKLKPLTTTNLSCGKTH